MCDDLSLAFKAVIFDIGGVLELTPPPDGNTNGPAALAFAKKTSDGD